MFEDKIYACDGFYTDAGLLDTASAEPLCVAFIGGSLTEGEVDYEGTSLEDEHLKWANVVIKFLSGLFPFRKITAVNAGLGGTESDYGAVRFQRDVLSHEPDIVFIEFSCNDRMTSESQYTPEGKIQRQVYFESMIRQCMEAEKVPVIIYMHVPMPLEGDMLRYYRLGCALKQDVADHYGIGVVDAEADLLREFDVIWENDPNFTLGDYYGRYYKTNGGGGFDVHPYASGYMRFAVSVINALTGRRDSLLRRFRMQKQPFCKGSEELLNERYFYLAAASDRIKYEGEWTLYTAEHRYESEDPDLLIKAAKYTQKHQFPDGIMQTFMPDEASFSFETEAYRICLAHVSARAGLSASVYADGVKVGEISCQSRWHGMNYLSSWVELPKGRKTVCIKVDKATEEAKVFRFGYIIEAFRSTNDNK